MVLLIVACLLLLDGRSAAADDFVPNDPGSAGTGGWQGEQWNFVGEYGVRALDAWRALIRDGRPGGEGVIVAVVDTGVAYRNTPPFRRSPDFRATQFVKGHDFVDNDAFADDQSGHGTHVAATISEATDNGFALTGLAYGARIMPVRALDESLSGSVRNIAHAIRWAARHGADVINLSVAFGSSATAAQVRPVLTAVRFAHDRGVVVVAAAGNTASGRAAFPAREPSVIAVGATTERGCPTENSNFGLGVDLVAPGGGFSARGAGGTRCASDEQGRDISQVTLIGDGLGAFGIPAGYSGTSMAAPHVAAIAALVIASGVVGVNPSPNRVANRLTATARDLGVVGPDPRYGAGLVDATAATSVAFNHGPRRHQQGP